MSPDTLIAQSIASTQTPSFDSLFSPEALRNVFETKLTDSRGKGIDRIGVEGIRSTIDHLCESIAERCLGGRYKFAPYLERLVQKGRGKPPRVLSIPTVCDRLVLHQLKELLHSELPGALIRTLPNECVRSLKDYLREHGHEPVNVLRADIKLYYDSILHHRLTALMRSAGLDERAQRLIQRAVTTPTVAKGTHRPRGGRPRNRVGVPQGLSVSNALANAYMEDIDREMQGIDGFFLRYVDDIVTVASESTVEALRDRLAIRLNELGLEFNPEKTDVKALARGFDFLGYAFLWPKVSIRRASAETFLSAIAELFTAYRHEVSRGMRRSEAELQARQLAFVHEVNEKITGAINGPRRYGWLFYYIEMDDLELLHSMDAVIRSFANRLPDKDGVLPQLKRLGRAYFEGKYTPTRGYILDYNSILTLESRLGYMVSRRWVDPEEAARLTEQEVHSLFEDRRDRQLRRLEKDAAIFS